MNVKIMSDGRKIIDDDTGGRKKTFIDWFIVEQLCKIQCLQEEIASAIGVCLDTLQNRCKLEQGVSFSEFYKQKRQNGKASLRRAQWQMAQKNPTMAIWLGKQYLDQTDKRHETHDIGDKTFQLAYNLNDN